MNIDDGNSYKSSIDELVEDWPENWRSDIFAEPEDQDDFVVAVGRDRVAGQLCRAVGEHHQIPQRNVCRHRKKRRRKMVQLNFGSHSIFLTGTRLSNHRSMSVTLVTRRLQGSVSSPQSGARGCKVQEETVWEHLKTCRRISSSASINQQTHCHCVTREREREGGADTKEARRALSQKENTRWPKLFCLLLLFPRKRRPPPPRLSASWFPPSLSPSAIVTAAGRHKSAAAGLSRSSVRGVPVSILA